MNDERLLALYERVADAPDAVARLRRFVLDLAVRGKLLEQDPSDEPASELLKRIAAEKAQLIKAKSIRKPRDVAAFDPNDITFDLPRGWAWTQISALGVISPRNDAPDDRAASFVPMPMVAAEYGVPNGHEPRPWVEIKKGYTHFAEGDVGLAKITPCFENGKSTVLRDLTGGIGAGTTELHVVRPLLVDPDYIVLFLKSPHFIETGIPRMTGTAGQKRVPTEYFTSSPFPLPPLAEQHRIVAKVDELMALCDRLEEARAARESVRDRLTAASLARLTTSDSGPDADPRAFPAHARFALDRLPALTARPDQIKTLRQTILNLAVRGKLVEQDPADEPASELLKRIAAEKARLVKTGEIKRPKPVDPVPVEERAYLVPPGWTWAALAEIAVCLDYMRKPINGTERDKRIDGKAQNELYPYYGATQQQGWIDDYIFDEKLVLLGEDGVPFFDPYRSKAYIIEGKTWVNNHAHVFRGILISHNFLAHYLNIFDYTGRVVGATRSKLNQARAVDIPVPLPPLAEQRRIVAKVDELMALCDRLEAALAETDATRRRLLEALLHEALAPAAAREMEAAE